MLTVHHLNNSRSQRILWLLEELNVPYQVKKYQRTPQQTAPKELLEINSLGKSPVITDGDVNLAESGAIVEYVIEKFGNGKATPPESGKLDNLYFSHYAEGSFMPVLVQKLIFDIVPQRSPFYIRPLVSMIFGQLSKQLVEPEIMKHVALVEAHLAKSKSTFFAGGDEPTSADYQMAFPLEALLASAPDRLGPKIKEYVKTIHGRPAYKRACLFPDFEIQEIDYSCRHSRWVGSTHTQSCRYPVNTRRSFSASIFGVSLENNILDLERRDLWNTVVS